MKMLLCKSRGDSVIAVMNFTFWRGEFKVNKRLWDFINCKKIKFFVSEKKIKHITHASIYNKCLMFWFKEVIMTKNGPIDLH
jgi:hypothetical protein